MEILDKIKKKKIEPRSRLYFQLRLAITIIGAAVIYFISVWLISFIIFSRDINARPFFFHFPWHLLIGGLILVLILELILRSFRFSYQRPSILIIIGLLVLVFLVSFFLERQTLFHRALYHHRHTLPHPLKELYEGI